jgi:hypothetical protein
MGNKDGVLLAGIVIVVNIVGWIFHPKPYLKKNKLYTSFYFPKLLNTSSHLGPGIIIEENEL